MCLKTPIKEYLTEEKKIQAKINECIDKYEHIKFSAGAGAGKTYALKDSLLYIIEKNHQKLAYHDQNILCITYTNVATNEIKERIGSSEFVVVSTIHERIWELIKNYQKELVVIHKEKIISELEIIKNKLLDEDDIKFSKYNNLTQEEKNDLKSTLIENRELYFRAKDKNTNDFRSVFNVVTDANLMSNVNNFKSIAKSIYKIYDYEKCLEKLDRNEYKEITYNHKQNYDSLHKMKISHDTLLEYGYKIVKQYDTLKKIIINKFPYILVDEYQDTSEYVIRIISELATYSRKNEYNLFIGYFGDTAQNIYNDGIGNEIDNIHKDLIVINKEFNRRSSKKVIDVISKIRNDDIVQKSIYEDSNCGLVEFYQGSNDKIDIFIEKCQQDWNIDDKNKLHCFVLKNELVAQYNGFENIYSIFKKTNKYKGLNYQSINTELVTNDTEKLGVVQNLFYRIIEFRQILKDKSTSVSGILDKKIYSNLNFKELNDLINILKNIDGNTIMEYIKNIFEIYRKNNIDGLKEKIEELFGDLEIFSFESINSFLLEELYGNIEDEDLEEAKETIAELLNIDIEEYVRWFNFVNRLEVENVIYHTYHSTKGLEFDNVVIIMENSFARNKNKFSGYFSDVSSDENAKNLLYVACSRAIKKLRIFYLDDISSFQDGIKNIFCEILEFNINKTN